MFDIDCKWNFFKIHLEMIQKCIKLIEVFCLLARTRDIHDVRHIAARTHHFHHVISNAIAHLHPRDYKILLFKHFKMARQTFGLLLLFRTKKMTDPRGNRFAFVVSMDSASSREMSPWYQGYCILSALKGLRQK